MQQYLLQNANILLDDKMTERFETYYRFLVSENEKYNLTAITEHDEVWCKHFADSMLGSKFVPHGASLVDVGCGAGFPSVPLAIARPDIRPTLVDSLTKRVNFCTELCGKVGVSANVVHARAEDFAKDNRQRFDVAVARAVAPLNILLEYLAPLVRVGGSVVAYKTDESEVVLAKNAANILGLTFVSANRFVLPDGSNRCLLEYKKVKNTPLVYPRGQNKPRKCPL
jgi:16S rRNA methyltransferase gidB